MQNRIDALKNLGIRIGPRRGAALVAIALAFLVPTMITNDYYIRIAISMCIYIMLVLGFRLMVIAGEFNMTIPAFMAIGAYTAALLMTEKAWNWWYCLAVAGVIAALIALVIGRIVLRIKGIYFAIAGFALVMIMRNVWLTWPDLFGGTSGISNIPSPNAIGGWEFASLPSFYYLGLCLALFTIIVMYRLEKSRYGLTLMAMGQADNLAESVGVNIVRYKLTAFAIGAFFAGIAGAFFASMQHFIDPEEFGFYMVLFLIVYAVAGGLRSFIGPILGVIVLLALPVGLKEIPGYDPKIEPIIFGGILVAIMLFLSEGFVTVPRKLWLLYNWLRERFRREEVEEYATS